MEELNILKVNICLMCLGCLGEWSKSYILNLNISHVLRASTFGGKGWNSKGHPKALFKQGFAPTFGIHCY